MKILKKPTMPDVSKYIPGKKENETQEPTMLTFPGFDLSDCKLALQKTIPVYGLQYDCWINPNISRKAVLSKMKNGDACTFRLVPYDNGQMYLCIDLKSGLDFAVVVNNVARQLRYDYWGCYMVGNLQEKDDTPIIDIKIFQPQGINL